MWSAERFSFMVSIIIAGLPLRKARSERLGSYTAHQVIDKIIILRTKGVCSNSWVVVVALISVFDLHAVDDKDIFSVPGPQWVHSTGTDSLSLFQRRIQPSPLPSPPATKI